MDNQKKKLFLFLVVFYFLCVVYYAPNKKPKPFYFTVKWSFNCSPACQKRLRAFRRNSEGEEDLLPSSNRLFKVNDLAPLEPQQLAQQRVRMRLGDLIPLKKASSVQEREQMEEQDLGAGKPPMRTKEKFLLHEIETPIYGIHVKLELVYEST